MVDDKMNEDLKQNDSKNFSTSEAIILVLVSLLVGLSIGLLYNNKNVNTKNEEPKDEHIEEFIRNYNYVLNNYYEEIDEQKLVDSAIAGMMESLDEYSTYIDGTTLNNFSITLDGSYKGLGIQIAKDSENKYILITGVFKDSPAFESGLEVGDYVISIDEKDVTDLTAAEFSSMVQESQKDNFKLQVLRNKEELEINITKRIIDITSVTSEIYEEGDKKIGYIYIGIFANNTFKQFKEELQKLENENINYLIIDVRSNTGGHLTSVDGMLDLFLNKDQIMYQFEQNGKKTPIYGTGNENKPYEIILMGDEASASASEVLIAGLKENFNCKLFGKKTFGKGTVQELRTLSDGTQYKITTKKWLTPKGNWINETEGIVPDVEVELDDKYFETLNSSDDTQLKAVLDYIKSK